MLTDPAELAQSPETIEEIEKATLRLVVQAIYDFREDACNIFREERDLAGDIGEDITREALDQMGMSRIDQRLFGKIDYKRARYVFHPEYAVKQALFVDSKAERIEGQRTATLQTSQLSMVVRQYRGGAAIEVAGKLPRILQLRGENYLTTTLFIKYNYRESTTANELTGITVAAVPNGLLQDRYNNTCDDTIWLVGRNAPTLGEQFRVRLSFGRLKAKAKWRVQHIFPPSAPFVWDE
ncbi:SfiI family type II restriction endonuclease [bacterium]|nr:SfiI family type II restriction endonuclease [bacterium]